MMDIPTTIGAATAEAADLPAVLEAVRTPRLQPRHGPWIGMLIVHRLERRVRATIAIVGR